MNNLMTLQQIATGTPVPRMDNSQVQISAMSAAGAATQTVSIPTQTGVVLDMNALQSMGCESVYFDVANASGAKQQLVFGALTGLTGAYQYFINGLPNASDVPEVTSTDYPDGRQAKVIGIQNFTRKLFIMGAVVIGRTTIRGYTSAAQGTQRLTMAKYNYSSLDQSKVTYQSPDCSKCFNNNDNNVREFTQVYSVGGPNEAYYTILDGEAFTVELALIGKANSGIFTPCGANS